MSDPTRIEMLKDVLAANPQDAFARYALAMEYSNSGDIATSLAEFNELLQHNPDYTNGYFMAAQTLVKAERVDEAKAMLEKGISSATRTGNRHAQSEMEQLLDEISR